MRYSSALCDPNNTKFSGVVAHVVGYYRCEAYVEKSINDEMTSSNALTAILVKRDRGATCDLVRFMRGEILH